MAKGWVDLLDQRSVTMRGKPITGRRIEDLSRDGMVPPTDAPPEDVVSFFRALDALDYGAGKQADETSLRMLSRGFGNERARAVLAASVFQLQQELAHADGNALRPEVIDEMESDTGSMRILAPLMKQVFAALDDVPAGGRETYSGVPLYETPDTRRAGFIDEVTAMALGQSIANPELLYDVVQSDVGLFGPDSKHYQRVAYPDEVAIVEEGADQLASAFGSFPEIVANAPISLLGQSAVMAKAMFAIVPSDVVPGFDERRREVVAAFMAPLLIGLTRAGWAPHPDKAQYLDTLVEGGDSPA